MACASCGQKFRPHTHVTKPHAPNRNVTHKHVSNVGAVAAPSAAAQPGAGVASPDMTPKVGPTGHHLSQINGAPASPDMSGDAPSPTVSDNDADDQ